MKEKETWHTIRLTETLHEQLRKQADVETKETGVTMSVGSILRKSAMHYINNADVLSKEHITLKR